MEREYLRARIARRTQQMFVDGVVDEVAGAGAVSETASQAIGFRAVLELIAGRLSERECIEQIAIQTQQYAKRQMTWFRREPQWTPVSVAPDAKVSEVVRVVTGQLRLGI
jgi:tRNA dimethylallyltransferase